MCGKISCVVFDKVSQFSKVVSGFILLVSVFVMVGGGGISDGSVSLGTMNMQKDL